MRCRRLIPGVLAVLLAGALWWGAWQAALPQPDVPEPQPLWILADESGRLAQYEYGQPDEPVRVWAVYTALLPEADAQRLRRGIPVYSDEELRRLVEDFGG